jgi:regulator of protease activity HflC (stomatin/prohibitin superfamily)
MADWDIQVAGSERQATILRGEADAVLMKVKEVAWAEAQREIIQRVTEGFRDVGLDQNGQVAYVIALRALETLEKMAGDPATKILLPNDMLMQLRDLRQVVATGTPPGGNGALQPLLTDYRSSERQ